MRQVDVISFSSENIVDRVEETNIILNEIENRNADIFFYILKQVWAKLH
ncbi:MAG: hypothetical protein IKT40_05535 [Bacilli bacterium]|nr:hypothetical protein [Bacilli bacterium]